MLKKELKILGFSFAHSIYGDDAIILQEVEGQRRIPVLVSNTQAVRLSMQIDGMVPSRPMTHDLLENFIVHFNITVEEILIHKVEGEIFYSTLSCSDKEKTIKLDARTSDAIVIAQKLNVKIYSTTALLDQVGITCSLKHSSSYPNQFTQLNNLQLKSQLAKAIAKEDYAIAVLLRNELNSRS